MFPALLDEIASHSMAELDDALAAAKRRRDEADMTIAAITAVVEQRQLHQEHGHRAVTGYLKQQLNCPAAEARRIKRRSRLLNHHPEIGDLLGASRVGAAQVDLLADAQQHRVAGERFAEFAPLLCEQAETLEYADLRIAVDHFINCADPDGSFDDHVFNEQHRTASVTETGGAVSVHAHGGNPIQAAEMTSIFDRAVEAEFHKDCEARRALHGDDASAHPLPRTSEQRKFDALHQICIDSVTAPADGKRPEPLVNIIIDPTTALEALVRHGLLDVDDEAPTGRADLINPTSRRCATSTGTAVHPDVALQAMIRGSIRRVVVDAHDVVINLGRTRRLFTGNARRAAQLLAVRCTHRGCDIPAEFCDVDHLDEWARDRGGTDQHNSAPQCKVHDQSKHRRQLRGRRDRYGRIHLVRPDGTVIKPLNARDPVWADPDPPRTIPWDEWVRDHAPNAPQHPEWTITVHDVRVG